MTGRYILLLVSWQGLRQRGASDASHSMSWVFDALGRVTSKGQTVGTVTKTVTYGYTNDNLATMTTPSGQSVVYGYNSNHQSKRHAEAVLTVTVLGRRGFD